jgi:hypothetical protein
MGIIGSLRHEDITSVGGNINGKMSQEEASVPLRK